MDWISWLIIGFFSVCGAAVYFFPVYESKVERLHQINREYVEYESPERFQRDKMKPPRDDVVGCQSCGMNDQALTHMYSAHVWYCFACAELYELNRHLRKHGIRRFKSGRS